MQQDDRDPPAITLGDIRCRQARPKSDRPTVLVMTHISIVCATRPASSHSCIATLLACGAPLINVRSVEFTGRPVRRSAADDRHSG
jgi:hypothetical protein